MAANKILSIRQLPILVPTTCWNVTQRNYIKERTLLKKMGYPEKPKRPPSGYLSFVGAHRAAAMTQNPNKSFTEISHILNQKWKDLPERERQRYNDDFQKKLAEYKAKVEEYNNNLTEKQRDEMRELVAGYNASKKERSIMNEVKRLEKILKKPRNPVSPFVLYCLRNSGTAQGQKGPLILKKFAEKWRNSPESEKQEYKDMFNKEYEQYKKDLQQWEEKMMQQGNLDLIRLKTLREKLQNSN